MLNRKRAGMHVVKAALVAALASVGFAGHAEVGITDTEILWGNSAPLSGPNAGYGAIGRAQKACFEYINAELVKIRKLMRARLQVVDCLAL